MKFSTKLILSFSFIAFLLVAIGSAFLYFSSNVKNRVLEKNREANRQLEYSGELGLILYRSLLNTRLYMEEGVNANHDSVELDRTSTRGNVASLLDQSDQYIRQIAAMSDTAGTGEEAQRTAMLLEDLRGKVDIYDSLLEQLFRLSTEDHQDANEFYTVTVEPYFRSNLIPKVESLREDIKNSLDRETQRLNASLETARTYLWVAAVLALLFTVGLVYYLYESFASPLRRLTNAVQRIGKRNFKHKIDVSSRDELGQLAGEFNRMVDRLNETTVSKNYVNNIIESMGDALIVTDRDYRIEKINSATQTMLGYTEDELFGESVEIVFEDENEAVGIDGDLFSGMKESHETNYVAKEGKTIPVSLSRAALFDKEGSRKGMVIVASDISGRKRAEEQVRKSLKEKEVLLQEIHHRVKNNLAVISGMLQMQIWDTEQEEVETALRDSQLRVQSIALVHEKLYQSDNLSHIEFNKYVIDLLQAISDIYEQVGRDISIDTELEPVVLTINQAIPCSLLLNELVVNVYKHAFGEGSNSNGKIKIDLSEQDKKVHLVIRDNGRGISNQFNDESDQSAGVSLVDTLIKQLEGEVKIDTDEGTVFTVVFGREEVT